MKFPHIKILFLPVALFAVSAFGEELDSLKAELNSIEALDNSTPGVLITGEFRSGVLGSILDDNGTINTGVNAATEADIKLQARPTAETRVTALFRIHQDWQKSHEEGISPVLLNWLSYDGKAWGGNIDFNLGDMRIAYTPLTIYTPLLAIENEAEIFAMRRKYAMAYNNLQNDGGRLLQGLNFAMHSGKAFVFDDLYAQGTLSRLRAQPRKYDAVFSDYDDTDRILFAGRGGLGLYGISLGANYTYTFTREEPLKNLSRTVVIDPDLTFDPVKPFLIENVSVFSGTIGVEVARLVGLEGWKIDVGAEYAMSNYKTANFYSDKKNIDDVKMVDESWVEIDGILRTIEVIRYGAYSEEEVRSFRKEPLDELKGKALLASLEVSSPSSLANANLKVSFIKNDKDFVSELAQNPVYYMPANVLNAGGADKMRAATTLENLYFATYTNDPLTKYNLLAPEGQHNNYPYNNYKKVHSLRSGYSNLLKTPNELRGISPQDIDPGVNLSLPFGLATPNRQGVLLKAECSLLDDKLGLNVFANKIDQKEEVESSYLDAGGGLVAEVGKFIGLSQTIRINGGYGLSKETDGFERSVNRASAGLRFGFLPNISLLGGMELVKKDYGKLIVGFTGDELLWLAGPQVELSRGSYFNLQYGMLNYKFEAGGIATELNRNLISADVRIKF